jgi:hypothetical protein
MKIAKKGISLKFVIFNCKTCKTVFEARYGEYEYSMANMNILCMSSENQISSPNTLWLKCKCPNCNLMAWAEFEIKCERKTYYKWEAVYK